MKKLFHILSIILLYLSSNLFAQVPKGRALNTSYPFSQFEQSEEILRNNITKPSHKFNNHNDVDFIEKQRHKIETRGLLKTADFDSTSVVDSVLTTKANGTIGKHIYSYDSMGNEITESSYDWEGGEWDKNIRFTYTYDANGNRTSILWELGLGDGNNWENYLQNTYTYDSNGNLTLDLREEWNDSNWVNDRQFTYTYDANGYRTSYFRENWEGSNWVNDWRYTYTRDLNGYLTSELKEEWDGSNWVNDERETLIFDSNLNLTSRKFEIWDASNWVNDERWTYVYDSNGNRTSFLDESWDGSNWVNDKRYTYTYDANDNRLTRLKENWDGSNWVNDWRETFTYDSNGNMTLEFWEEWDGSNWVNDWRYTYTYDSNGNMTYELWENWDGSNWVNDYHETYSYEPNGNMINAFCEAWDEGKWIAVDATIGFYDSFGRRHSFYESEINAFYSTITDVYETIIISSDFSLSQNYPNPFNPNTTIKYSIPKQSNVTIKVFDVLGSEVVELVNNEQPQGNYEIEFDGSSLTSGIYLYRYKAGNYSETKKMILLK